MTRFKITSGNRSTSDGILILQAACRGYLQVLDLSLSFLSQGIAKSPKRFFAMFLFFWREVSSSFLKLEVQNPLARIFQGIHQILKLDLQDLRELSLLLVTHLLVLPW